MTPRTAGFNSVDTAQLTQGGALLTMLLMLVGGSSGSTAGGMKITTVAVLLLTVRAYVRQDRDVEAFGRRLGGRRYPPRFRRLYHVLGWRGSAMLLADHPERVVHNRHAI